MNKMKPFLLSFLLLPASLFSQSWSLQDPNLGWNSKELVVRYFHNSELQTQWAWEALSHYQFRGNERVIDFGSGDGKISALMSFMVPQGYVTGVEISKEMVNFASKMFASPNYKNLSFLKLDSLDFSDFISIGQFDLITSFCVFHMVPEISKVLKNMRFHLRSEGRLVTTFPIGGNIEFFRAASEELEKIGLSYPPATDDIKKLRNPLQVASLFEDAGFKIEYMKVIPTRNAFSTKEEMIDYFEGTLSANWNIPKELRREFFTNVADRYLQYRPEDQGEDGFVYFSLNRIDLIAKPAS